MNLKLNKKFLFSKYINQFAQLGFSTSEMVVSITIIGILATLIVPNFTPALEFIEVLLAEKYLLGAVKECQVGIVNKEINPSYTYPTKTVGLGIIRNNKYVFSHTGIEGECYPYVGGNKLRVSRINSSDGTFIYSLIINVISGEKSYEGQIPDWLDWWGGEYSPIINQKD